MPGVREIFIGSVVIITLIIFVMYFVQEKDHQAELAKIKSYEDKAKAKERELEIIRARTTPCHISGLNDARSCYYNSKYECTWNNDAERCDKKV